MSELTYKKIIDVEQVETLNDAATVFINDNGAMKQVAADKFGTVKTVNGVEPDENGDIQIETGAGGVPRLFVINEPIDEEPFAKMTPSMTYEELKALLEADNPPILVMKEIYGEEGVQDVALSVQNCSYFIGDGVIKMHAGCEMRYTSDGTFEPVPV